jgi:hypothetical protein
MSFMKSFMKSFTKSLSQSTCVRPACTKPADPRTSHISLVALLLMFLASPLWSQSKVPGTPSGAVPTTFVGVSVNNSCPSCVNYPFNPTDFGVIRLWDTGNTSWPEMQPLPTDALNFTNLDRVLQDAYHNSTNNQAVGMYTFGQVPQWASNNSDATCVYGAGTCDPPSDLNVDGTGADLYWRTFISTLAVHLNFLNHSGGYAPVKYFEVWNEIDRSNTLTYDMATSDRSYNGTDAQLLRMLEDMKCILTGSGTIHNYPSVSLSTACSITKWSTSGTQISGAKFLSPSSHAQGTSVDVLKSIGVVQNFLYCNDINLPLTNCNWKGLNWGASAVDIINFHMKPGNEFPIGTDPESTMKTEYLAATSILKSPEQTKPFWNGEAGYSGNSPNAWDPKSGDVDLSIDYVQQAAFVARYMLVQWSLGIQNFDWYQWDKGSNLESGGTTTDAGIAYSTVASWMIGSTMGTSGCANVSGYTDPAGTQTLWSCTLTQGSWTGEVFWDTNLAYNCYSGTCATYGYSVTHGNWSFYQTPIGFPISISPPYTIQVSNLPVILMTSAVP